MHRSLGHLTDPGAPAPLGRTITRLVLGAAMAFAGNAHLTFGRRAFQVAVPDWVPVDKDVTVVVSGIVELALGGVLLAVPQWRRPASFALAAFLVAVFPGNVSQYQHRRNAIGLDTDRKRAVRLALQAPMVAAALWAAGPAKGSNR